MQAIAYGKLLENPFQLDDGDAQPARYKLLLNNVIVVTDNIECSSSYKQVHLLDPKCNTAIVEQLKSFINVKVPDTNKELEASSNKIETISADVTPSNI